MSQTLPDTNVVVVADVYAKDGQETALGQALEQAVQAVRTKDGYLLYRLHQDMSSSAHFVLYEIWRDKAAADAHHDSGQFHAFLDLAKPLADRADIFRMKPIAE